MEEMMKKFRSTVVLIMAVCLILELTACGESANEQPEASASEVEKQEADFLKTEENEPSETEPQVDVSEAEEDESSETTPQTTGKEVLVAYFSATGTTKGVAEKIAGITDADLYEIVPANPYSSKDLNYNDSQSRATVEMNDLDVRPEIGSELISLDGYTTLYIGYPIWWGEAPLIMSTFVENYDFEGITVIPFCTSGSSDIGNSYDQLADRSGSGTWISGKRFSGNVSESDLKVWIEESRK